MNKIILTIFLVLFTVFSLIIQVNLSTHGRTTKYLKEDLEIAVHDASLALDEEYLSEGYFVFDEEKALGNFKDSFERNTGLTEGDYSITLFKVFDQMNTTFPYEFKDSKTGFSDIILYPTVLAIVQTSVSKYFFGTDEQKMVDRVASYTYRLKRPNPEFNLGNLIDNVKQNENGFYWVLPYTNNITSTHGTRLDPFTKEPAFHKGIDIADSGVHNQPVISALDGTVIYAGNLGDYGNLVVIDHGKGLETRYAHLNSINVRTGQKVKGSDVVGRVGTTGNSTGSHLHFEIRVNGEAVDPLLFY
jgi:Peptidase family M23